MSLEALPDHDAPADVFSVPGPLAEPTAPESRPSPAEEARTIVACTTTATLGSLSEDGGPWASMVAFATLRDGRPVLVVSTLAEHGRNLLRDGRASLSVVSPARGKDPLDSGRVSLAGRVEQAAPDEADEARDAYVRAVPPAGLFAGFGDFHTWVLRVERVRWVGGYGRMDSVTVADYAAAQADPVAPGAAQAIDHLNADHADALLQMARNLAGYTDATNARCVRADRYGLDLAVETPRGRATPRVGFDERLDEPRGLRAATVSLAHRARGTVAAALLTLGVVAGLVAGPGVSGAEAAKTPKRVVAITPFTANITSRLGIRPVAVGADAKNIKTAAGLAGVQRLKLAHPDGPNLETLLRLKPDLLLSSPNWRTGTPKIQRQGIEVVDGWEPMRVNTVSPAVRRIARKLGKASKAAAITASIDRGLRSARQGITTRPKVLLVLGVGRNTVAFLPNSWGGDMVSYAGGRLLTSGLKASPIKGTPGSFAAISDEEVLARDPDVIVVVPHGNLDSIEATKRYFAHKPGWAPTRAAKDGRIEIVDPDRLLQASDDPGSVVRWVRHDLLRND
jgi:ABC-type Fe3+-hydroxamate transport system substrate-binding protein/putative heme iron utilization protein